MTQKTRRKIDAALKAKIALEALREAAAEQAGAGGTRYSRISCAVMRRPHQAFGHRTPMGTWHDGMNGGLLKTAVDMTLRLSGERSGRDSN